MKGKGVEMNKPNKIIWHHTWRPEDNKLLNDFKGICNYHTNVLGWRPPCGYHFVIEYVNNKLVCHEGRKMWETGAHTRGQNDSSVGICVIGNFDIRTPTDEIYRFCAKVVKEKVYNFFGVLEHKRHSDYSPKSCPGKLFDVKRIEYFLKEDPHLWKQSLKNRTDFPDRWENGLLKVWELIGTYPELEIFRFFPDLIEKYEKLVK